MSDNLCGDRSSPAPSAASKESGGTPSGQQSGGDGLEGEEQEEPSSSSSSSIDSMTKGEWSIHNALSHFREQWQKELQTHSQEERTSQLDFVKEIEEDLTDEAKAKKLFEQGIENEQSGKLYEAIQYYRRAVQLVPDIEFRLYDSSKFLKPRERQETENSEEGLEINLKQKIEDSEDDDDDDSLGLLTRLQKNLLRQQCICMPQFEQKGTHISVLPMEILLYIMRWVVSSDLDMRSLEVCSRVSRGFYVCSRDPEIWKLACLRVWGVNCGGLTNYDSWRQMFICRPKLYYNGCYISKTTYLRHGENSFQDQFYRPWHIVEYYRYLRFFPEGLVLMLTTPDEPPSSLLHLRTRSPRHPTVLSGHYRLSEDKVVIAVKRQETALKLAANYRYRNKRRDVIQDNGEQTFHLEFKILTVRNRIHAQLVWQRYSVFTKYRNGVETSSTFDLPGSRYPPFWFSRVKSYAAESENPLQ